MNSSMRLPTPQQGDAGQNAYGTADTTPTPASKSTHLAASVARTSDTFDVLRSAAEQQLQLEVRATRLQMGAAADVPTARPDALVGIAASGLAIGCATGAAFTINRTSMSLGGPLGLGSDASLVGSFDAGNVGLTASGEIAPGTDLAGFASMTTTGAPGLGITVGHTFSTATGLAVGVSGSAFVIGSANYVAEAKSFGGTSATMTVSQSKSAGGQAALSVGSHGIGIGVRGWKEKNSRHEFTTQVDATLDGQAALKKQNVLTRTLRALNVLDRPIAMPKAHQLQRLGSGDSVKEEHMGLTAKSVALSVGGVYTGAHRTNVKRSSASVARPEQDDEAMTATLERVDVRSTSVSLDLPIFASATQANTTTQRLQMQLESDNAEALSPMLMAKERLFERHFDMPFEFSPQAAEEPQAAMVEFLAHANAVREQGVTLTGITFEMENDPRARQATVMPLVRTLFKNDSRAGLSFARSDSKEVLHTNVSATQSRVMQGFENTRRQEIPLRGARLFSTAMLNVTELTVDAANPSEGLLHSGTFLRLRRAFDFANPRVLDDQTSWLREFIPSLELPARPATVELDHSFELDHVLLFSLTHGDRLAVAERGLLLGVDAPRANADAQEMAAFRRTFDRALANSGESAVRRIVRELNIGNRVRIDLRTNIAAKAAKRVTHSLIKLPSFLAKTSQMTGKKLAKSVEVLMSKKDELELVDTAMREHPLFFATPLDTRRERDVLAVAREAVHQMARKTVTLAAPAPLEPASKETLQAISKLENIKKPSEGRPGPITAAVADVATAQAAAERPSPAEAYPLASAAAPLAGPTSN